MFELAFPWVFAFLPLPVLLWFLLPHSNLQLSSALKIPFFNAVATIVEREKQSIVQYKKLPVLFLIWCLLLLALASPRWVGEPKPVAREGYNIMLALDISGSMELTDMLLYGRPATRLAVVKHTAIQFVRERSMDKIGLILFGSRAYLQTPLTYDHQNVITRLEDATVGLAGKTTSIGDALGLAVKRLQNVPPEGRVIILLTDGVNNSGVLTPLKAAELARADAIKVYTIGLGSDVAPQQLGDLFLNVAADLDEQTLQEVAKITGGQYFRATDMQSLQQIYQTINQLETIKQEQEMIRPQHDYYPWPLALSFLLFLYWLADLGGLLNRFALPFKREAIE
ncbi:VWA domain-containing protein [Legionella sp. 27cVA30]|uniref:VWA domain-containing protein n=1 Tax=Legionella sp. 27cVA30 TaxID=2905657 RepID=UPI00209DCEC5|nr:VWA domain-containing protein [Legionella sp. 27cVA30]